MDAAVLRAIAKWPDVPNVYGWLSLTRRGDWRIRGERIDHAGLVEFIARNYERDPRGAWYFQNGPQRVYVSLAYTPMVYRLGAASPLRLDAHTGRRGIVPRSAWLDDGGSLLLESDLGPGLLDDRDLAAACEHIVDSKGISLAAGVDPDTPDLWLVAGEARLAIGRLRATQAESLLGFIRDPAD